MYSLFVNCTLIKLLKNQWPVYLKCVAIVLLKLQLDKVKMSRQIRSLGFAPIYHF